MNIKWKSYSDYQLNKPIRSYPGFYSNNLQLVCRCNILKCFDTSTISDQYKDWIIRTYINSKCPIESILDIISNFKGRSTNFLWYASKFDHIAKAMIKLYDTRSTWDIAKLFQCNQTTIRVLYGPDGLDVTSRSMRCSKIHLQMKPIIESIIGPTETEHYFHGYWFDEYSSKYNLDIEIDGEWCHDPEKDAIRDKFVQSKGLKVIRIKAYTSESDIIQILKSKLDL